MITQSELQVIQKVIDEVGHELRRVLYLLHADVHDAHDLEVPSAEDVTAMEALDALDDMTTMFVDLAVESVDPVVASTLFALGSCGPVSPIALQANGRLPCSATKATVLLPETCF